MHTMSANKVKNIVNESIIQFKDDVLRQRVKRRLLEPFAISLKHERDKGGQEEVYQAWAVCKTLGSGGIVYACGGFAENGYPWGLVDTVTQRDSGPLNHWYSSFENCLLDTGWCDEDIEDSE